MLPFRLTPPTGEPMSVLAIGAPSENIEIGAGGLLLELARSPLRARYVVLAGTTERQQEARVAARKFVPGDLAVDLFDLPDGRLPAVWDQVKEILEQSRCPAHPTSSWRRRPVTPIRITGPWASW